MNPSVTNGSVNQHTRVRNNETTKQRKCESAKLQKYETTNVRNNERTKQRNCVTTKGRDWKQRKGDAKLRDYKTPVGRCETTIERCETTRLRNIETAKQRKSDAKQRKGDAKERDFKQRKCEVALYPDTITSRLWKKSWEPGWAELNLYLLDMLWKTKLLMFHSRTMQKADSRVYIYFRLLWYIVAHSFIHAYIDSFIHSFIHSSIYSFIHFK